MNAAREKVEREGVCRSCGTGGPDRLDAAHVVDRSLAPGQGFEDPDAVVPLCSRIKGGAGCHEAYDGHELDLLPELSLAEQAAAVAKVGLLGAFLRTTGQQLPEDYEPAGTVFDA